MHRLSTVLEVPRLIIGAEVPPYLGVVETHIQSLLYVCRGLVCFDFPRRPMWEDCEEE